MSTIVTVHVTGKPRATRSGNETLLMIRVKFSSSSIMLSSTIWTSNGTLVTPAGTMTVYGPEL